MTTEFGEKIEPEKEGVIFLLFRNGKVLLEDRKHPQKPYFGYVIVPGGKVEKEDTSHEKAAEREVLEECGIKVKKMICLDTFLHITISNHLYRTTAYLITDFDGEVTNKEGKADHVWAKIEDAYQIMQFSDSRYVLKLAEEKLIKEGLL